MSRRKGYGNFIRKVEGIEIVLPTYPLPNIHLDLQDYRPVEMGLYNAWLSTSFSWCETEQGHNFWSEIHQGYGSLEDFVLANSILNSWRKQQERSGHYG